MAEINYWSQLEKVLGHVREQINSEQVQISLQILNQAKRFREVMNFTNYVNDTEKVLKLAKEFKTQLKDF